MALMALSALLTREGFTIRWTAQLGAAAIQRCIRADDRPDVLLVDMALADMTGVDVCRTVRRWTPSMTMIGVTAYDPDVYCDAAMAAGARQVISKDDIAGIARAIRDAAPAGDPRPFTDADAVVGITIPSEPSDPEPEPERSFALSRQQTDIMRLYADGHSTEQVADALGISKGTVFAQVARVREKLHARDRNEAVALCRRYLRM
ncbi:LuxR family two component transcriptional regulator [Bifidobacterium callitrichos DSM 23973]|nr:LuxR family two component transcriptional regulator [Bifidobacterium callitrichos DSM 23973]